VQRITLDSKVMWIFTDVANWWDEKHRQSQRSLDEFVENNPNQFAIVLATAAHTSMVLGAGLVDVLRLGDGVAQGTLRGVANDGLRVLAFAGPAAKFAHSKIAQVIVDTGGPICSWVASTKALAHTGQRIGGRMFVAVEDLARAVGIPVSEIGGISLQQMTRNLSAIGASIGSMRPVTKLSEVVSLLRNDGSVVLVSFRCMRSGKEVGGHAMYVFRDYLGRLRIMDRSGIHSDLKEITKHYDRIDEFAPRAAVEIKGMYAKYVDGVTVLAMEARGVVATER
jgi:hypothetical protein